MNNPAIDVIIVNYNSTDYTIECIGSIYRSARSLKVNIIIVDNGSTDCPQRLKKTYPGISLFFNKKNSGFSKANNLALKGTDGEFVVFLNPDTVVDDNFFPKIIAYLKNEEDVAIVGPGIFNFDGSLQGSARRFPSPLTPIFGRRSLLTRLYPQNAMSRKELTCFGPINKCDFIEVDWVSGACMVARKNAIKAVGGFDEGFFLYWEDADLCKRLSKAGWRIVYYPSAIIHHHTGKSSRTVPMSSTFHFHKSCYRYFSKHTPWPLRLTTPMVLAGLSFRCLFIMTLNRIQQWTGRPKIPLS